MDKYAQAKAEITVIFHENKGRYGYRRISDELHNRKIHLNHKTVQRLMKELGLVCRVRMKKYRFYKGETGKIADNTGLILHSDQGWHYQHKQYRRMLEKKGIEQSISRKGNYYDNSVMENFLVISRVSCCICRNSNPWNASRVS